MKLIKTYEQMDKREFLDCRMKSLKEFLRHYDIEMNSFEVLILCEGFAFSYCKINIPGISIEDLPYATVSQQLIEAQLFDNLNLRFKEEHIGETKADWLYMKSMIDHDIPILFRMDSRFLTEETDAAPKQIKLNLYYLSTLLLVGYDKDQVQVVLTNTDEKEDVHNMSMKAFQKYRRTECMPFSPEQTCFYLTFDHEANKISKENINQALLKSLTHITDLMLNEGMSYPAELGAFIGQGLTKGIYGMRMLEKDLQLMLEHYDNANSDMRRKTQLLMVFLRNNIMFGSKSAFRLEFGTGLKSCSVRLGMLALYDVGAQFEAIGKQWKKFLIALSEVAHFPGDLSWHLRELIRIWASILQSEEQQFNRIRKILIKENR